VVTRGSFPAGKAAEGVKLIIHLRLVPRSRIRGTIPPLPRYALIEWCSVTAQGLHIIVVVVVVVVVIIIIIIIIIIIRGSRV
jgi:hypothetical protein